MHDRLGLNYNNSCLLSMLVSLLIINLSYLNKVVNVIHLKLHSL